MYIYIYTLRVIKRTPIVWQIYNRNTHQDHRVPKQASGRSMMLARTRPDSKHAMLFVWSAA